jgi:hypothetical protein
VPKYYIVVPIWRKIQEDSDIIIFNIFSSFPLISHSKANYDSGHRPLIGNMIPFMLRSDSGEPLQEGI